MNAILLTYLIVLYFFIVGYAFLVILHVNINKLINMLISPIFGISIVLISLFTLSRIGFSINEISNYLFLTTLISSILIVFFYIISSDKENIKKFLVIFPLIIVLMLPFLLSFLKFDLNWISFVNGDFSFYSLASERFKSYGFSELPSSGNIYDFKDYSLAYWKYANEMGHRTGSEILLAYISSITGFNSHQVYMPFIVSIFISTVMTLGAIAYSILKSYKKSLFLMLLIAVSPVMTIPIYLQLLAQSLGLAHLILAIFLFIFCINDNSKKNVILFSIVVVSFSIVYSEILPFLFLFLFIYMLYKYKLIVLNKKDITYKLLIFSTIILLLLNTHIIELVEFIKLVYFTSQESSNMTAIDNKITLFPTYLTPALFPFSLGIQPYGVNSNSALIFLSIAMIFLFIYNLYKKYNQSYSFILIMFFIFIVVGFLLFYKNHAYGVFKITMLINPFFILLLFFLIINIKTKRLSIVIYIVIFIVFLYNHLENTKRINMNFGISPVPFASLGYVNQLKEIKEKALESNVQTILTDTHIRELSLLESYYFKGITFISPTFGNTIRPKFAQNTLVGKENKFKFSEDTILEFQNIQLDNNENVNILLTPKNASVLNKSNLENKNKITLNRLSDVENLLLFKNTQLATSTIGPHQTFFQIEKDPMSISNVFVGIGRYHLYDILNFENNSELLLEITASYNKDKLYKLPTLSILGSTKKEINLVGNGSARVLVNNIEPQKINNSTLLGIDFGYDGNYFKNKEQIGYKLFNNQILQDPKKISLFARNISLINRKKVNDIFLNAPQYIKSFPKDLANENLIYSGIFEDGWVADEFYVNLTKKGGTNLVIRGMIPQLGNKDFNTKVEVVLNGKSQEIKEFGIGDFQIIIPVNELDFEKYNIYIKSSNLQQISKLDSREVSFLIKEVSIN